MEVGWERRQVAVVGAGPTGVTAANLLAEGGLDVVLISREREPGSPTICGEFIPDPEWARSLLPEHLWWVVDYTYELLDLSRTTLTRINVLELRLGSRRVVELEFPSRVFDRAGFLRAAARRAGRLGAELRLKTTVSEVELQRDGVRLILNRGRETTSLHVDWLVAADGIPSTAARSAGLGPYPEVALAVNQRRSRVRYPEDRLLMWVDSRVAPGGYAWIIPRGRGTANVGLGYPLPSHRPAAEYFSNLVARLPQLSDSSPEDELRGRILPVAGLRARLHVGRLLLAGDAAGTCIPSNGGGINTGMISGALAGSSIVDGGGGAAYESAMRAHIAPILGRALRFRRIATLLMKYAPVWELVSAVLPTGLVRSAVTLSGWPGG